MLNDITIVKCEVMSHLVWLRGKDTVQCAHCAVEVAKKKSLGHLDKCLGHLDSKLKWKKTRVLVVPAGWGDVMRCLLTAL